MTDAIRLATAADYPADRLIGLPTRVDTGESFADAFDIAERTLGEKVQQGTLFTYLFRRFGHPNKGSDAYKDLAAYLLTTTKPDMLLKIVPYSGGDVSISFTFLVPHAVHHACEDWIRRGRDGYEKAFHDWIEATGRVPDWAQETADVMEKNGWPIPVGAVGWRRMMVGVAILSHGGGGADAADPDKAAMVDWYRSTRAAYEAEHPLPPIEWRSDDVDAWDADDPLRPYAEAMTQTLRDLLRPVWIRDEAIGIYGAIDERHPEVLGNAGDDVEYADTAGYALGALGNVDPAAFTDLSRAVMRLSDDPSIAMARAAIILDASVDNSTSAD